MANQRPSLWRVLSDTSRIISSNSLHFAALSLLFIFPITLFNIIYSLTLHQSQSHYGRLLSAVSSHDSDSQIPSFDKSQILSPLLYALILLLCSLCSVSSITNSIFHGFHTKPIKFSSSLKSILSSFLPLLATKLVYFIIMAAITFGFGLCMGFVFMGMMLLGFATDPNSKSFMAAAIVMVILLLVLFVYFGVKWCLVDPIVVVESKYGFAPFERSSNLVKGVTRVALFNILLFAALQKVLWGLYAASAGRVRKHNDGGECSGGVVAVMVIYACLSTMLSLFSLGANTVLLVHCKAFIGEVEVQSDEKLGQVYVQLPRDVVDEV